MKSATLFCIVVTSLLALSLMAQDQNGNGNWHHHEFQLTSSTFSRGGTFPLSMVAGSNLCSFFSGGQDESPELSWSHAPRRTRSFVVILYDVVAGFTHWGMYNIAPTTTKLPENAGVPNSPYGQQIGNDFGDENYDGPCPPPTLSPASHHYVFTVYALDVTLPTLPAHGDFPPLPEGLYHVLIHIGRDGHILDKASIDGSSRPQTRPLAGKGRQQCLSFVFHGATCASPCQFEKCHFTHLPTSFGTLQI